jgi:hypothetical protein
LLKAYAGRSRIGPAQLKCREEHAFAGLARGAGMPRLKMAVHSPVFGMSPNAVRPVEISVLALILKHRLVYSIK